MQLSVKGLAGAGGIFLGGMFLATSLVSLAYRSSDVGFYGQDLLDLFASVYPGYRGTTGLGDILLGTTYALVDGAIAGASIAWLYNRCASRGQGSGQD